jgi:gluconokinase
MTTTLVVMGVSGAGKTTVAEGVATRLGWDFAEGDDFHPAENVAKMHAGMPLTDEDRWPWLHSLADWIGEQEGAGHDAVMTCSALKRAYRAVLQTGHPSVLFVDVEVDAATLRSRLEQRKGHYMPASLLDSQLATLEPLAPDEPGLTVPGDAPAAEVVAHVIAAVAARTGRALP